MALDDHSEPEPDAVIVLGEPDDYLAEPPRTALLVVEISDTTLAYDRGRKQYLYARASIAEYWVINLVERVLEVYREPIADAAIDIGWRYARHDVLTDDQSVTPLGFPAARGAVRHLLPRPVADA